MASDDPPKKIWSTIDVVKICAGSLAAVSAAVAASTFGVAGTLTGAALASVVGSIGTELYAHSLSRGYRRLRRGQPGAVPAAVPDSVVAPDRVVAAPATTDVGAQPATAPTPGRAAAPRWKHVAALCAAAFALGMVLITAFEVTAGRSLAGLLGDGRAGTTTIGTIGGQTRRAAPLPPATDPSPKGTGTDQVAPSSSGGTSPGARPSPSSAPGPSATAPPAPTSGPTSPPAVVPDLLPTP